MTRRRMLTIFGFFLAAALVLLLPMRLAIAMLGLDDKGLAARDAHGPIWWGGLRDARIASVPLGDLRVALDPLPLLIGRANVAMGGAAGNGWVTVRPGSFGVQAMTMRLPVNAAFAPAPVATLAAGAATIRFAGERCSQAEGRVRATFTGDIGGLSLAQGLSGTPRCEGGMLVLPMISTSGMERLTLRIDARGGYKGEFLVRPTDPAMALKLTSAGFVNAQGGLVMRMEGSF